MKGRYDSMNTIDPKRLQALKIMVGEGADTEKKITAMTVEDIVMIDKIKAEDIRLILQLQKEVRKRNLVGFLTKGTDEEAKEESDADDDTGGDDDKGSDAGDSSGFAGGYGENAGADTGAASGLY